MNEPYDQDADDEAPVGLDYWAWTIIANAYEGDWDKALPEWKLAAIAWRDAFHESLAQP